MYQRFYGFKTKPFPSTCPPNAVFLNNNLLTVAQKIEADLRGPVHYAVVTGSPGIGKTTLSNYLGDRLDDVFYRGVIDCKSGIHHLLQQLLLSFGVMGDAAESELLPLFKDGLLRKYQRHRQKALLVMENAHHLSQSQFGHLCEITERVSGPDSLLKILLLGRPLFLDLLQLEDLDNPVYHKMVLHHLKTYQEADVVKYIRHQLAVAAPAPYLEFTANALRVIAQHSAGVPLNINQLCERSLHYGAILKSQKINEKIILEALADLKLDQHTDTPPAPEQNPQPKAAPNTAAESGGMPANLETKDAPEPPPHLRKDQSAPAKAEHPPQDEAQSDRDGEKKGHPGDWDFLKPYMHNAPKPPSVAKDKSLDFDITPPATDTVSRPPNKTIPPARASEARSAEAGNRSIAIAALIALLGLLYLSSDFFPLENLRETITTLFQAENDAQGTARSGDSAPLASSPATKPEQSGEQQEKISATVATAPEDARTKTEEVSVTAPPTILPEPTPSAPNRNNPEGRIAQLLEQAKVQFEERKLTLPPGDSALESYRQILQLAPSHPGALEGIRAIKQRYQHWGQAKAASGELERARYYFSKILEITADEPAIRQTLQELDARIQAQAQTQPTAPQPMQPPLALETTTATLSSQKRPAVKANAILWTSHTVHDEELPVKVSFHARIQGAIKATEIIFYAPPGAGRYPMYDDGSHGDAVAGDGEFFADIVLHRPLQPHRYAIAAYTTNNTVVYAPPGAGAESYLIEPVSARLLSPVVINEFMASNDGTIADPQGDYDDWIELYNTSAQPVDLSGYYLSDDSSNPKQWRFPNGTRIEGHGYLLIWADKETAASRAFLGRHNLHANFKLSKSGEEILLVDSDEKGNTTLDHIKYGEQASDRAMARLPDGEGRFTAVRSATPGRKNTP